MPHDVIVIGAGLGGLTAAARLVREGVRVLVLDRNTHPAGTAYTFQRRGFQFPMGPLGFSSPGILRRMWQALGEERLPELTRVHYRLRAFGLDLPLSGSPWETAGALIRRFPEEAGGITRFWDVVKDLNGLFQGSLNDETRRTLLQAGQASAREFLDREIGDDRVKRILGSQGTAEPYGPLLLLAAQWRLLQDEGIWYPAGGLRLLGDRLGKFVTCSPEKGEVRLGAEAARIILRDGKVVGVALTSGEVLEAPVVVSNADFKNTFLRLLEREVLPVGLYEQVSRAGQTESNLQVALGLKRDRVDLAAFQRSGRLIFRQGPEQPPPRWDLPQIREEDLAAGELELCLWSRDDPALAPEGHEVLVIRTAADYAHFARLRPAWKKRSPLYGAYKRRLGQALIEAAERILPGLSQAVEVLDVATPLTFEERGGRSQGSVAGWSWNFEDTRDWTPRELVRTPITGLFMAGYQAFSALFLGGVPTALESGARAAEYILRGEGPLDEMLLPGWKEEEKQ
ncbi:MAG: NAD(P)/FAD-dependent oxidoreductase [Desulfobacterota bacterium]|nr:NAD(P)/FAD-dependent oxidoreductase [Thermodesulfobacteriota bacterium]